MYLQNRCVSPNVRPHKAVSLTRPVPLQEGSQLSGLLAGLQAERDMLLRSASDKDAELSSLRQQAHSLQSSLDQERDRHNREMEALRAQLQQQVWTEVTEPAGAV